MWRARPEWPLSGGTVGDRELVGDAEREGRIVVEEEGAGVVVVEEHQHVRLLLRQPRLDRLITLEQRDPVRIVLLAAVVGAGDGGNVGSADAADDVGHD
jgi:hypothetical protein